MAGNQDKRTPRNRARDSVGGVLGLTPTRPDGRNLQVARAVDAAAAAAARLDGLETAERSMRKKRTGKKSKNKYVGIDRARKSYSPRSRKVMAMYAVTHGVLDDDEDEDNITWVRIRRPGPVWRIFCRRPGTPIGLRHTGPPSGTLLKLRGCRRPGV